MLFGCSLAEMNTSNIPRKKAKYYHHRLRHLIISAKEVFVGEIYVFLLKLLEIVIVYRHLFYINFPLLLNIYYRLYMSARLIFYEPIDRLDPPVKRPQLQIDNFSDADAYSLFRFKKNELRRLAFFIAQS